MYRFLFFAMGLLGSTLAAQAHELRIEISRQPPIILVTASYGGQEPLLYAPVDIFSPDSTDVEFQNGRTDARGRFAFLPDRSGEWRIIVDDELGHHQEISVVVEEVMLHPADGGSSAVAEASTATVPLLWRWLTGISLILGLTGILFWLKAHRFRTDR
ncbi:MAG: hypothetical protein JXQ27_12490 [Acidobacteria bacterium]|nr:hypothetical protein [Acidobacteriota bacterium]